MRSTVEMTVFMKAGINDYMHAMDLDDGGMKAFGGFKDISYTTDRKVNTKYYKDVIRHLINSDDICYVQADKYFSFKPEIEMLSVGTHFTTKNEMIKKLIEAGYKEVR